MMDNAVKQRHERLRS